ncbi:unnamed protein product, partial [Iphiclides podalirius]
MLIKSVLLCLIFIVADSSLKKCDSCISIWECDPAINLVKTDKSEKTRSKIKNSVCKINTGKDWHVCCSDFLTERIEVDDIDEIEEHYNRHLLPNTCGEIRGTKIFGGVRAGNGEFPWMVLIYFKRNGKSAAECGASLINDRYVLTAAHCVRRQEILGVRVGEYDLTKNPECESINKNHCTTHKDLPISDTIIHPNFKQYPKMINDIALLRLRTPANFSCINIKPICLPLPQNLRERTLVEEVATVAGWGLTERQTPSNVLLKTGLAIRNNSYCDMFYPGFSEENKICAGHPGNDTCRGDSGGPLKLEDNYYDTYRFVQYGIVSYGGLSCGSDLPGVYTDVRQYLKWILDTIRP